MPVSTVKLVATPRCVTGTPTAPGTASADEIPGTIATSKPCARKKSASSPPRPNTNGSPPLRRTTAWPARASASIHAWITSCGVGLRFPVLPTSMMRASAPMSWTTRASTSASTNTTSARRNHRTAATVSSSGSPGPAPTSATWGTFQPPVRGSWGSRASGGSGHADTRRPCRRQIDALRWIRRLAMQATIGERAFQCKRVPAVFRVQDQHGARVSIAPRPLRGGHVAAPEGVPVGSRRCRPHSLWSADSHHQRPERTSSPGATARVHGAQPMLG